MDLRSALFVSILFAAPAAAQTTYTDRSVAAGLIVSHSPAYGASFAAGGTVGDFDRDGDQDVYVPVGGNSPDRLFINNGNGTFTDQAAAWGIATAHRGTAATVADFDGDGWLDLFVTSLGPAGANQAGAHKLYKNVNGTGFTDVASSMGVEFSSPTIPDGWGGAFGDYDLDGDLDLCVAGWFNANNDSNRVFRNDGATFTDVTNMFSGINGVTGFAPRWCDMNGDRYPELIFIGDFSTSEYWINVNGTSFTNFTAGSGTSLDGTEMGATIADWDEDGDFDLYVTTINTNNLYINQGGHVFVNQANATGTNNTAWGWGTTAVDFDNDTWFDIVAATQSGRQFAFRNNGTPALSFTEVALTMGLNTPISMRGVSNFDYDNDGDQDIVFFPHNGQVKLFRNELSGPDRNWLRIFLDKGDAPFVAPNGIGSVIKVTIGSRTLMSRIDGGSNYMSMSELSAHFGLGAATHADLLRIEWTDGSVTELTDVAANQTLTLTAETDYETLCSGDGGVQVGCTDCPCGNTAPSGTTGGCLNSAGTSTRLEGTGSPSVSLPSGATFDLRFWLEGAPAGSFCILNSGAAVAPQNMANPCFGLQSGAQSVSFDGLRCSVQGTRRHGGRSADGNGQVGITNNPWGGEAGPPAGLAVAFGGFSAGETRYFQVIHREDALLGCMRGLNTSQAVLVNFQP